MTLPKHKKQVFINTPHTSAHPIKWMASITFGMPSKNCKNYGICKISSFHEDILTHTSSSQLPQAVASVHIKDAHHLDCFFLKQFMTTETIDKYFSSKYFLVGESISFTPQCDCSPFVNTSPVYIKQGAYPIEKRPWGFWVRFSA